MQGFTQSNNLYKDSDFRTGQIYAYAVGILKETDEGYSFKYDGEYAANTANAPVSLTLPLRKEEYTSKWLFPFFDGLIPEGWLLNIVTHNWKLDSRDRFGILLVACKDPIGAVSIRGERE